MDMFTALYDVIMHTPRRFFGSRFPALHQWMLKQVHSPRMDMFSIVVCLTSRCLCRLCAAQVNKLILAEDMLILNAATNRYNGTAEGGTQLQQQHNHDPNSAEGVAGNPAICALAIPDGAQTLSMLL
jgi:hypothetical protein